MVLESQVAHPQKLVLVVDKNPFPLVTIVHLTPDAAGFFNVRIKMGKTSLVRAYVATADKVYTVTRKVKVTIGGCGG
jgi:sulfur-oxidizing protein SoxY